MRPLDNTILGYRGDPQPTWLTGLGLVVYDLLAHQWAHNREAPQVVQARFPGLVGEGLIAGHRYAEATTDDAALVLHVLEQATRSGGLAVNYAMVEAVLRLAGGQVAGVAARDTVTGDTIEVRSSVVVNAAGAWSDGLRAAEGRNPVLRLLRGSHLLFPAARFPLPAAVSMLHPDDGRPVFAYPWHGVTLLGTTDVDHDVEMATEVRCTSAEAQYLMAAVDKAFAPLGLSAGDAVSSLAGVRPVVRGAQADPSKESRDALLLDEDGLISIVGGKLTTFRPMARRAVAAALRRASPGSGNPPSGRRPAPEVVLPTAATDADRIRVAARTGFIVHLDDLLLRRTRVGLTSADGGLGLARSVRGSAQPDLGWDDTRWNQEEGRYGDLWHRYYSPVV